MPGHWIVVASAEHVRRGRLEGFIQACHGKEAPLRRIQAGDGVVCYSPTIIFAGKARLRAFTAIGVVRDRAPYRVDTGEGFRPWRRDVAWVEASEAPIQVLLETLDLTAGKRNWGYQFWLGLIATSARDFRSIAEAMRAQIAEDACASSLSDAMTGANGG